MPHRILLAVPLIPISWILDLVSRSIVCSTLARGQDVEKYVTRHEHWRSCRTQSASVVVGVMCVACARESGTADEARAQKPSYLFFLTSPASHSPTSVPRHSPWSFTKSPQQTQTWPTTRIFSHWRAALRLLSLRQMRLPTLSTCKS